MTPTGTNRPRIGIPWRTSAEESQHNRPKIQAYEDAVRRAGGEPDLLSLADPALLAAKLRDLDGFILPGSPADVEPANYGARNSGRSEPADLPRERTDWAVLEHAFAEHKPVLAICYGCQLLNVFLGGTLIQDLRSETGTEIPHRRKDIVPEPAEDPLHSVTFLSGSRLIALSGRSKAEVNSSHHQSVERPGRELKVTGTASDGIVESVEWAGDANWIVGVQWHPERMVGDALAERLFSELVATARSQHSVPAAKS